jgi:hypothetical protein
MFHKLTEDVLPNEPVSLRIFLVNSSCTDKIGQYVANASSGGDRAIGGGRAGSLSLRH